MGMFDKLKVVCGVIVDTALDATASVLTTSGSVACAIGGMGFALAQGMNKTFTASYYGKASALGDLAVNGTIENTFFGFNYSLPMSIERTRNGEDFYNLTDYTNPGVVLWSSSVCVAGGFFLKSVGNTLKRWQQYRYDERYNTLYCNLSLPAPSAQDFLLIGQRSLCDSFTIAMLSHSIMSGVVSYSDLFNANLRFTYPFTGDHPVNSTYYNGPVARESYPVDFKFNPQTVTMKFPYVGEKTILLNMSAQGIANVTYGGGVFFKENHSATVPPLLTQTLTAIGGLSAYMAGNFFARKERYKRDNELQAQQVKEDTAIQDEKLVCTV